MVLCLSIAVLAREIKRDTCGSLLTTQHNSEEAGSGSSMHLRVTDIGQWPHEHAPVSLVFVNMMTHLCDQHKVVYL